MCLVSVIMSCYREQEDHLRMAIESILNQTIKDFEFIIILDDPNNRMVEEIVFEYANSDSRIIVHKNEINVGLANSLNVGISLAKGKYICRMDADDISVDNRIEKQVKYICDNDFDLIGGITDMIDENGKEIYGIKKVPYDFEKIKKLLKYNQCIAHSTWFGKRSLFIQNEGYRNIPYCEDYDFTLRAVLNGYKISNLNEPVLKYRMTSQSISRNNLYDQYLYGKYISDCYTKGKIAVIDDARDFVISHASKKRSNNYLNANVYFNDMLSDMSNKRVFSFIKNGIKLLFCSSDYLNKIYRLFMLTINS